jgi:hypothetical protein
MDAIVARGSPDGASANYPHYTDRMCMWLFERLSQFGISSRNEFLLFPSNPFELQMTPSLFRFLTGRYTFPNSAIPDFISSDRAYQNFLRSVCGSQYENKKITFGTIPATYTEREQFSQRSVSSPNLQCSVPANLTPIKKRLIADDKRVKPSQIIAMKMDTEFLKTLPHARGEAHVEPPMSFRPQLPVPAISDGAKVRNKDTGLQPDEEA